MVATATSHKFLKGNTHAVANSGPFGGRKHMCTKVLISQLNEMAKGPKGKLLEVSRLHQVCDALITNAQNGDVAAAKEIFDRVQGRVQPSVDLVETHNLQVAVIVQTMPLKEAMSIYSQLAVERPKVLVIENDENE